MNEHQNKSFPTTSTPDHKGSNYSATMGPVDEADDRARRENERPETTGPAPSSGGREIRGALAQPEHHLPDGPDPRVSFEPVDFEEDLLEAFESGDPVKIFDVSHRAALRVKELTIEVSQLRFKQNFGSQMCDNCDGLKAGPGVVATCFQVKQCNFTNIKEIPTSKRHLRVIYALSGQGTKI